MHICLDGCQRSNRQSKGGSMSIPPCHTQHLPACHWKSPRHSLWLARVQELENEGLDTSDAQGIADMELEPIKKGQ